MLELARRTNNDPRTLGTLFHAGCDELRQVSFDEAMVVFMNHLQQQIKDLVKQTTDPLMGILKDFVAQIPAMLRQLMLLPACIFERSM